MQNSRRDFLRRIALTSGIIATSQLPVWAEEKVAEQRKENRMRDLSFAYGVVNIGLEKPFSVLHISDTHLAAAYPHESSKKQELKANRMETFGYGQEEALALSLSWAKNHTDYLVHTGDLIDWQSEANFDLVRKYFGREGVIGCVGNHELVPDMWLSEPKEERTEAFKDLTRNKVQDVYPFDVRFQSTVVNGVNFITLDDIYGYVTQEQVDRFKEEVRKGLPIVLCVHVPFITDNIWRATIKWWNVKGKLKSGAVPKAAGDYLIQQTDPVTRNFIKYLKKQKLLRAILTGHEHITIQDQFSPTCTEFVVAGNYLYHVEEILFI